MGEWRYSFPILSLSTMWQWLHTLAVLPLGRLGGPQGRSGRYGGMKNLLPLPRIEL
jgi:hypothetical protein